ncbi:GNAT family N-acetyltransferase [Robbsia sp. Bb-Pol-6]|uniref:GNAT family N-acetyltransferase n=1 Tax=Robbsia betulipollinis TaxID=2981849 RepID=A0ABT3ZHU2_9BURK|nr:GNAT family N-acetyltransferase [Robbsia betulipollinis]MCY0386094.1 GNAT family N-acetyltransferase [Robbsia betulipollinis]
MEEMDACHLARQAATHAHLYPGQKAVSIDIAGGTAMLTETRYGRKLNHVAGAGMLSPFDHDRIARLERQYEAIGLRAEFDLCPHVKPDCLAVLARRCYTVNAFSNSYALTLAALPATPAMPNGFAARLVDGEEARAQWIKTSVAAFSHVDTGRSVALAEILARNAAHRLDTILRMLDIDGAPAGSAAMAIFDTSLGKTAHLYIAGTLPEFRKRGVQAALLHARLQQARDMGCVLATLTARPHNGSARNAERAGFTLAYTKPTFVAPDRRSPH